MMNTRITSNLKGNKSRKIKQVKGLAFPHMHVTFHTTTFSGCKTKTRNQTFSTSLVQLEVKDKLIGRTFYTNVSYT